MEPPQPSLCLLRSLATHGEKYRTAGRQHSRSLSSPIEVKRELDNLNHNVLQEPTGLRRRLSTNELDEIIRSRQTMIDGLVTKALEQERGALIRTASATLTK